MQQYKWAAVTYRPIQDRYAVRLTVQLARNPDRMDGAATVARLRWRRLHLAYEFHRRSS